jgi:sulfur-oxidizing protein SoxA
MKKVLTTIALVAFFAPANAIVSEQDPGVQADIDSFQKFYKNRFPQLKLNDFSKGPYAMNEDKMLQFEAAMDMPPFEDLVDKGESLWNKKFKNGSNYASCFTGPVAGIRPQFPRWNSAAGKVETLEAMIQNCRVDNGEKKIGYKKGKMAYISAFLTTAATGEKINVIVPKGDAKALAAYNDGKRFFYAKRGQLNMSCADCHVYNAGSKIRGDILSPALGQITHFPVWRGKWARKKGDGFGTIQRRYGGCNKQVRAKPFKTQKDEYTNLEFFHTAMSNGLEFSGTEYRQ